MEISNWINLIAAILVGGGTLALAVMAYKAIRQTRSIQKAERRERLLNDIIEWAIDITKCSSETDIITILSMKNVENLYLHVNEMGLSFKTLRARNQYVREIALPFEHDLNKAVEGLIKVLEVHIGLLDKSSLGMASKHEVPEELAALSVNKQPLTESANKVIEEAIKIKTRDIG